MNTRKRIHRLAAGITMVESLVALVVISVGMLGIAGLYVASLQASRAANLRVQAVNLAAEMGDRIRANRTARASYNLAAGALPAVQDCTAAACTPAQLAQHDQNEWVTAMRLALPGALTRGGAILYVDNAAPLPDRYEITISWREAGADEDGAYRMVMEL